MNVVVVGWAGAGKTTIAGTLARIVAADGADVLVVEGDLTSTLAATLGNARAGEVAPLPEDLLNRVKSPEGGPTSYSPNRPRRSSTTTGLRRPRA